MEVLEVSPEQYSGFFPSPYHIFNSGAFAALNAYKCEKLFCLVFKDSKVRLGLTAGLRNGMLVSPFSAPFGGFQFAKADVTLRQMDTAVEALEAWARNSGLQAIRLGLPPAFYHPDFVAKQTSVLRRAGYEAFLPEVNYQFATARLLEPLEDYTWYNARKNLKRAQSFGLRFEVLPAERAKEAYDIIARNRQERGFPLRMTWEQVYETIQVVPADFFMVYREQEAVASAVVFHVAPQTVQVIYWGDLPQFAEYKTMNFLSSQLFAHYHTQGIAMVDIGPSTEDGIPNHGLCEFKESIGCQLDIKSMFIKHLM